MTISNRFAASIPIAWPDDDLPRSVIGGKAAGLAALRDAGWPIPPWFVVTPSVLIESLSPHDRARLGGTDPLLDLPADLSVDPILADAISHALSTIADVDGDAPPRFAVRSSAAWEDDRSRSFAGQLDSFLHVPPSDVCDRIVDVWRSAFAARPHVYARALGDGARPSSTTSPDTPKPSASEASPPRASNLSLAPSTAGSPRDVSFRTVPAVIVQRMVDADASGVAFSADPISGRRSLAVVSATHGTAEDLVDGSSTGTTLHVDRTGTVTTPDDPSSASGGDASTPEAPIQPDLARRVATMARDAAAHAGSPQDVEWAVEGDTLYLLQSRPITTLHGIPDPDAPAILWDNSNVAESYTGVTTPLTFSFARDAYAAVYRAFCRELGVPDAVLDAHEDTFASMIGLVRGRIYYNLKNWYEVLSLLPGFQVNRRFMEDMMGVRDALPDELVPDREPASWSERLVATGRLTRSVLRLIQWHRRLPNRVEAFQDDLDAILAPSGPDLNTLRLDELADRYRTLEDALLRRWHVPIVNDFMTMVFCGLAKETVSRWTGDDTLYARLMAGTEPQVSVEPIRRIRTMADLASDHPGLVDQLLHDDPRDAEHALDAHPKLAGLYRDYLDRFGDRCLGELKLESPTLHDDPSPLLRAIGARARHGDARHDSAEKTTRHSAHDVREEAERDLESSLRGRPLRKRLAHWLLHHARQRTIDRETLRFERTRVFGTVRRIVRAMGQKLAGEGVLDDPHDVFYLDVDELMGFVEGTGTTAHLSGLARTRRDEFEGYRSTPAPPDRCLTRGAVGTAPLIDASASASSPHDSSLDSTDDTHTRAGLGCSPGTVSGRVRVVRDPQNVSLNAGDVLVAERTDPGWTPLFAACRGLIVAHGNLLSHAAIVAREMSLPAVVGIPDATEWLTDGDHVELDGRTGRVRRLSTPPPTS